MFAIFFCCIFLLICNDFHESEGHKLMTCASQFVVRKPTKLLGNMFFGGLSATIMTFGKMDALCNDYKVGEAMLLEVVIPMSLTKYLLLLY